jgi:hypothetical protein
MGKLQTRQSASGSRDQKPTALGFRKENLSEKSSTKSIQIQHEHKTERCTAQSNMQKIDFHLNLDKSHITTEVTTLSPSIDYWIINLIYYSLLP